MLKILFTLYTLNILLLNSAGACLFLFVCVDVDERGGIVVICCCFLDILKSHTTHLSYCFRLLTCLFASFLSIHSFDVLFIHIVTILQYVIFIFLNEVFLCAIITIHYIIPLQLFRNTFSTLFRRVFRLFIFFFSFVKPMCKLISCFAQSCFYLKFVYLDCLGELGEQGDLRGCGRE